MNDECEGIYLAKECIDQFWREMYGGNFNKNGGKSGKWMCAPPPQATPQPH